MDEMPKAKYVPLIAFAALLVAMTGVLLAIAAFAGWPGAFWVSYWFVVLAVAANVVVWYGLFRDKPRAREWFLGYPILKPGYLYVAAAFIAAIVMTVVPRCPVVVAVAVHLVLLAAYVILVAMAWYARETITELDGRVRAKVLFTRTVQADLTLIANACTDPTTQGAIAALAEKMRYSDPMSHDNLAGVEAGIVARVDELKGAVERSDYPGARGLCTAISQLIEERNLKTKLLKG